MDVLKCFSLPVVVVKLTIGKMEKEGRIVYLYNNFCEANGEKFFAPVTTALATKLAIGDSITIVCIPQEDMKWANETLALSRKKSEGISEHLLDKGGYSKYLLFT